MTRTVLLRTLICGGAGANAGSDETPKLQLAILWCWMDVVGGLAIRLTHE